MNTHKHACVRISDLLPESEHALAKETVSGISTDSRTTNAGDLFFACATQQDTCKAHIEEALQRGAVAAVVSLSQNAQQNAGQILTVDRLSSALEHALGIFYNYPSRSLAVYGVTGTDGKTSVCTFIAQLLENLGSSCGLIGTLGCRLGEHVLYPPAMTTPDASDLHRTLAQLRDLDAASVALEVSSHALKQERVMGVVFDTAVFTNLDEEHLDYHVDKEDYLHAKSLLFRKPMLHRCVLNGDDEHSAYLERVATAECVYYTMDEHITRDLTIRAEIVRTDAQGTHARIMTPWGKGDLKTTVPGRFNLSNILAALGTLAGRHIPLADLLGAVRHLRLPAGRMQCVDNDLGLRIVIDFAHTANALYQTLRSLRSHCDARLWCVFGCGGGRDRKKRSVMGAHAATIADYVVLTDDNPRDEPSEHIIYDILSGIDDIDKVTVLTDRASAIGYALSEAREGDCVLIAGKGHERYTHKAKQHIPFNDTDEVQRYLGALSVKTS